MNKKCDKCGGEMTPLMSDINSTREETFYWWKCYKCLTETDHLRNCQNNDCEKMAIKRGYYCRFHCDNLPF